MVGAIRTSQAACGGDAGEHGWPTDGWPEIWRKVETADIIAIVIGTPIWLGEEIAVCRRVIERLYAMSGDLNDKGQSIFYGKVGGGAVTSNEDGGHSCCAASG